MEKEVIFYVYQRETDNKVVVSLEPLPDYQMEEKKKYVGKNAKLEAIYRVTGEELPDNLKSKEVGEYLNNHFYGKPIWKQYMEEFNKVCDERELKKVFLNFRYEIKVLLPENVDPSDSDTFRIIREKIEAGEIDQVNTQITWNKLSINTDRSTDLTIDEAFKQLINTPKWYQNSGQGRRTASYDKKRFEDAENSAGAPLTYERKVEYLQAAGYKISQPELWRKE